MARTQSDHGDRREGHQRHGGDEFDSVEARTRLFSEHEVRRPREEADDRQQVAEGAPRRCRRRAEDDDAHTDQRDESPSHVGRPHPLAEQRPGDEQHECGLQCGDHGGVGHGRVLDRSEEQANVGGEGEARRERRPQQPQTKSAASQRVDDDHRQSAHPQPVEGECEPVDVIGRLGQHARSAPHEDGHEGADRAGR